MFIESDINNEILSLLSNSKYRNAVELLKAIKKSCPKEYEIWIMRFNRNINSADYLQNSDKDIKSLFPYLIEIADEEVRFDVFNRIHWFRDWAKISPTEANDLFENIIFKDYRDKNLISKYLITYCYDVLPYIKFSNKHELKKKVMETEGLIIQEELNTRNIGDMIQKLVIILADNYVFDVALEMTKRNIKLIKKGWLLLSIYGYMNRAKDYVQKFSEHYKEIEDLKNTKDVNVLEIESLKSLYEEYKSVEINVESIDELEFLNMTVNELININNSVNKQFLMLIPKVKRQLKYVKKMFDNYLLVFEELSNSCEEVEDCNALKNSCYTFDYFFVNTDKYIKEYLEKYDLEHIDDLREIDLLNALRQFILLDIGDKGVINSSKSLLEQISRFDLIDDEKYLNDLKDVTVELQYKLIDVYIDDLIKNSNEILESKGMYINIPWEQAEELISKIFNEDELAKLNIHPDIARQLKTAEWAWQNNVKLLQNVKFSEDIGQDLTFAITSYLKLVEIYLCRKIYQLANGKALSSKKGEPVIIGSEVYFKHSSAGDYIRFIRINYNILLKSQENKYELVNSLYDWLNNSRNAHLHKDAIIEFSKASKIREKSISLLSNLINSFK